MKLTPPCETSRGDALAQGKKRGLSKLPLPSPPHPHLPPPVSPCLSGQVSGNNEDIWTLPPLLYLPSTDQAVRGGGQGEAQRQASLEFIPLSSPGRLAHIQSTEQPFLGCRWTGVNSNKTQY